MLPSRMSYGIFIERQNPTVIRLRAKNVSHPPHTQYTPDIRESRINGKWSSSWMISGIIVVLAVSSEWEVGRIRMCPWVFRDFSLTFTTPNYDVLSLIINISVSVVTLPCVVCCCARATHDRFQFCTIIRTLYHILLPVRHHNLVTTGSLGGPAHNGVNHQLTQHWLQKEAWIWCTLYHLLMIPWWFLNKFSPIKQNSY